VLPVEELVGGGDFVFSSLKCEGYLGCPPDEARQMKMDQQISKRWRHGKGLLQACRFHVDSTVVSGLEEALGSCELTGWEPCALQCDLSVNYCFDIFENSANIKLFRRLRERLLEESWRRDLPGAKDEVDVLAIFLIYSCHREIQGVRASLMRREVVPLGKFCYVWIVEATIAQCVANLRVCLPNQEAYHE